MRGLSYRTINIYGVLIAMALLTFATYLQMMELLPPCPLCIMQRLIFALLGLLCIIGVFHVPKPRWRKSYNTLILLIAIGGIAIAIRHIYLQSLPLAEAPSCGPGLNFLFKHLPITEAVKMMFLGSGECAMVHWKFLGLSIPMLSLSFFILYVAAALFQIFRKDT